jgi:hypothetical protein
LDHPVEVAVLNLEAAQPQRRFINIGTYCVEA